MIPPTSKFKIAEKTYPIGNNVLIHEEKTPYQLIRLFKNKSDYWLSLNGEMQFHTQECYKSHYHMCKIPLMMLKKNPKDILVIGGGDGLPTQELLKHIPAFTQVELDPELIRFTKKHPIMRKISRDSFNSSRVNLIAGDGLGYLINSNQQWDLIIDDCDFSVSDQPGTNAPGKDDNKKYEEYRRCLLTKLKPHGIAVFMEAMYWPWRDKGWDENSNLPQFAKNFLNYYRQWEKGPLTKPQLEKWKARQAKEDIEDWEDIAPHIKSSVVDLPIIGPEHYIYMSNQPF